ncbi:MAG TPA: porin family protein, partial [Pseudolabrys sp.]
MATAGIVAAGAVSAAGAADLPNAPIYKAPVAATYNWTGFYAGGNVGYGWQNRSASFVGTDASTVGAALLTGGFGGTVAGPASFSAKGVTGGLQGGYNWQVNRNWLVGLEADFNWANVNGTGNSAFDVAPGAAMTIAAQQRL